MSAIATFKAWSRVTALIVLGLAIGFMPTVAWALITGGTGNAPLQNSDWPRGAAAIFNSKSRVAYWEGPPFGGGHWHAECRGNAQALSAVLADFAKLDVKNRRVVLHDGVGSSFWLRTTRNDAQPVDSNIDWAFHVWGTKSWEQNRGFPPGLRSPDLGESLDGPPSQIDVYAGGNIRWEEVQVPKGLVVEDQRKRSTGVPTADQREAGSR